MRETEMDAQVAFYGEDQPHVGLVVPEPIELVSASIVKTRKARKARGRALGLAFCAAGVATWVPVVVAVGPVSVWTVVEVVVGMWLLVAGLMIHETARMLPVAPPPPMRVRMTPDEERRLAWFKRVELRRGVWTVVGEEMDRC